MFLLLPATFGQGARQGTAGVDAFQEPLDVLILLEVSSCLPELHSPVAGVFNRMRYLGRNLSSGYGSGIVTEI